MENKSENINNTADNKVNEEKVYQMGNYQFQKADRELLPAGTSNILGVYDDMSYDSSCHSLYIGQLLTLFGNSDYITDNNEDLLSYVIEAKRDDGKTIYMEAYYGPSGPAIGGISNEEIYENAAKDLAKLIRDAKPTDYEVRSDYDDMGVTIIMGVKNGKAYYDTEFPEGFDW